jgi:outer membrane receptor protein involved in Fe transport
MIKANVDVQRGKWGVGLGYRYYSFMQKIDPVLEWFVAGLAHYRQTQTHGTHIWDARFFYQVSDKMSASIQVQNVFNAFYATRPAKPDAPRNVSLQFTWRID